MLKYSSLRSNYLDFVKGVAIILVVLGHNIQFGSAIGINDGFYENSLFRLIYSFHMPLFMVVSGYLFYFTSDKYTFIENIKSRFTRFVVPIVSWTILNHLVRCMISGTLIPLGLTSFLYSIWFLWAIFWCSLAVLFVRRWGNDNIGIYLFLGIVLLFVPNVFFSNLYVYMYPYFVVGYLWNKYSKTNLITWMKPRKLLIIIVVGILLYIPLYLNFSQHCFIYKTGTCIFLNHSVCFSQIIIDFYRYAIGFVGVAIVLMLIKYVFILWDNRSVFRKIASVIEQLGRQSLGIYIISDYLFNQMILKSLPDKSCLFSGVIIIETLLVLSITSILTSLIAKSRISSKILLGGK